MSLDPAELDRWARRRVAGRQAAETRRRREQEANEPPRCATQYCWHRAAEHDDQTGSCRSVKRYVVEPYEQECVCAGYTVRTPD